MCQPMQRSFISQDNFRLGGTPSSSNIPQGGHGYYHDSFLADGGLPSANNFMRTHQEINQMFSNSSFSSFTPDVVRGLWTTEEDRLLIKLVNQNGAQKWSQIAKKLIGRVGKQCRERWNNHLRPDIKKDIWSEEEERLLVEAHKKMGNKWAEISRLISGRTENSVKNHWNSTKRRHNSDMRRSKMSSTNKKKATSSKPSILLEYIQRGEYREYCNTNTSLSCTLDQLMLPLPPPLEPMMPLCLHSTRTSHHVYDQSLLTRISPLSTEVAPGRRGSHSTGTNETAMLDSLHLMGFNNEHIGHLCTDAENDFPDFRDCDILLKQDSKEVPAAALDCVRNGTNCSSNRITWSDMYLPSICDFGYQY